MPSDDCEPDSAVPTDFPVYDGTPPIYASCPDIYNPLKDFKYVRCNANLTAQDSPCELLKELHRAKEFRAYFLAILPVILSVFALILNAVYLGLVIRIYRNSGSSQRKRYIFLISRSGSSLMALVLFYVVLIYWKAENSFHYSIVTLFIIGGGLNFLSIAGTYIALTCLLYTAVVYPIVYKTKVTMRHCYALVALIWLLSIAASICIGLWGATLFYPCTAPMTCNYSTCQKPFAIGIVVCLSICYATVLILYSFLLFRLHTRYKKEGQKLSTNSTVDRQRSSMVAMNRLGMNMGTFAVGSVPILIVCIVALSNLQDLTFLGLGRKDPCKTYLYSKLFVEVEILASVAALVWILAMILDPVINTIADKKISGMLREDYKRVRKRVRSWRRSSETKTTVNEPEDAHEKNRNSST